MMKNQNISTPITSQSDKMHSAKQKMLVLLFLPMKNKRQILRALPQSLHPPKCLFRFSSLWVRSTEEKMWGNQCQNWRLRAALKNGEAFSWRKIFGGNLNYAISTPRNIPVSRVMAVAQSFICVEGLDSMRRPRDAPQLLFVGSCGRAACGGLWPPSLMESRVSLVRAGQ